MISFLYYIARNFIQNNAIITQCFFSLFHTAFMTLDSTTINLYDFIVKEGNGIKGLVDSGLSEVPDLYIQPPHERITAAKTDVPLSVIDLSKLNGPEHDVVVEALVKAAETVGFFQVVNHGVSVELLEGLKDAVHDFFNQAPEKKAVYRKGASTSPLVNYGTSFMPEKEKHFQWKDYLSLLYTTDADALNHWPDNCKEVALNYLCTSTKIAKTVLEILMNNLGVVPDNSMIDTYLGSKVVNMNFYPTCPDPGLTIGIGRHSDIGTLTVLLQDDIGGLSVRVEEDGFFGKAGEWIEVPPIPGALLINIGDTLQVLSNGIYKSAEHRARTTSLHSRVSIPVFLNPTPTTIIGPFPQVVEKDGVARYKDYLYEEYKSYFFANAHHGKNALDLTKITPVQGYPIIP